MAKSKTYSIRLDEYENAALDFLVKAFQDDTDQQARNIGIPAWQWSRSAVIGTLISIELRERAEAAGKTPKDLIGLCREWEK